jgi:hypothetical protein
VRILGDPLEGQDVSDWICRRSFDLLLLGVINHGGIGIQPVEGVNDFHWFEASFESIEAEVSYRQKSLIEAI